MAAGLEVETVPAKFPDCNFNIFQQLQLMWFVVALFQFFEVAFCTRPTCTQAEIDGLFTIIFHF